MFNRLSLWLLSVCCLAPVTTEAFAQKGGGGTTPPPPLPNVRYTVQPISLDLSQIVHVSKINNAGMIVGRFNNDAFIYNQPSGALYQLNRLPLLLTHLNTIFRPVGPVGSDWFFGPASGINELGHVVGRVRNSVTLETEGFAMDTDFLSDPLTWKVKRLPSVPSNHSFANSINSSGEVLGVYVLVGSTDRDCFVCSPFGTDPTAIRFFGLKVLNSVALNNNGTVAGVLGSGLTFYSHRSGVIQTVNGITDSGAFGGINDGGIMSVRGVVSIGNKRRTSGVYRASVSDSFEKISDGGSPRGLNQNSDFALNFLEQPKLAYNGLTTLDGLTTLIEKQVLLITDLIPDTDLMKSTLVNNPFTVTAIGDRNSTGFGQLAGTVSTATGSIGVVLTPYVPGP